MGVEIWVVEYTPRQNEQLEAKSEDLEDDEDEFPFFNKMILGFHNYSVGQYHDNYDDRQS